MLESIDVIGHCCICHKPIERSQVYLDFDFGGEFPARLFSCEGACETEAYKRHPPREITWDAGGGPVRLTIGALRVHPPIFSTIELEPFQYNPLLDKKAAKREKMRQTRCEQARLLRRKR